MKGTTPKSTPRELDYKTNDHIEVRLQWNSLNDSASVSVDDTCYGELFAFDVAPAHALEAFRHPIACAANDHDALDHTVCQPGGREETTIDDQHSPHLSRGSGADR